MIAYKVRGSGPDPTGTQTDAVLVVAARAGDERAREALCRRHMRLVLGLAQRVLAGREAADDVAQDAFVEAFQRLDTLQNPQAFASWMSSIVVRRAGKHLRRARLLTRLGLRSPVQIDPNSLIAQNAPADVMHELRGVYSILAGLPPEERVALILRRVDGMELQEIARHMGLSLATIKRRLSAAEARLERAQRGSGTP
jgi:RNA polymerase sigma-70 factor (ECF subfamily)